MPRKPRHDEPGVQYHVMNRGVARRTIFESRADYRFFLACLARAVRRGEVSVLAYALMRTHFHLLLRSHGSMSDAMRRIQMRHTLRFNRLHDRDGPLMRGRFLSKPVQSDRYAQTVLRYIHENPVLAGVSRSQQAFPWSSAGLAIRARVPHWFSPDAIERYGGLVESASREEMLARADLAMHSLLHAGTQVDEPADGASRAGVLAWVDRRARLADGVVTTLPVTAPRTLQTLMDRFADDRIEGVMQVPGGGTYRTRELLLAGLLRDAAGCAFAQIAELLNQSGSRAQRLVRLHRRCVRETAGYAELTAELVGRCLAAVGG